MRHFDGNVIATGSSARGIWVLSVVKSSPEDRHESTSRHVAPVAPIVRSSPEVRPPQLCKPCLFYGGDLDQTGPNSTAFYDENTNLIADTSTYGAVTIPQLHGVLIEGFFFQIVFDPIVKLDPNGVTWEIRTGVSEGNGGTVIASGEQNAILQPTGRGGNGPEYTVAIKLKTPLELGGGTFWFNITPICTNQHDPVCSTNEYGVSNTTHQTNSVRGGLQPAHQMFVNSKQFAFNWKNWCDNGNQEMCADLSFGLIGKVLN